AEIFGVGSWDRGQAGARGDVVTVAVVFDEIAIAFIRIEEQVFVPTVVDAVFCNGAALEADDFVLGAAKFSACSKGNERAVLFDPLIELLEDLEVRVLGVEDAMTLVADDGDGAVHGAECEGCAAIRTIECAGYGFGRDRRRAHYQPSKVRKFFRWSESK